VRAGQTNGFISIKNLSKKKKSRNPQKKTGGSELQLGFTGKRGAKPQGWEQEKTGGKRSGVCVKGGMQNKFEHGGLRKGKGEEKNSSGNGQSAKIIRHGALMWGRGGWEGET